MESNCRIKRSDEGGEEKPNIWRGMLPLDAGSLNLQTGVTATSQENPCSVTEAIPWRVSGRSWRGKRAKLSTGCCRRRSVKRTHPWHKSPSAGGWVWGTGRGAEQQAARRGAGRGAERVEALWWMPPCSVGFAVQLLAGHLAVTHKGDTSTRV